MWWGNTIGSNIEPSQEEYEELDGILNEFEGNMDSSNI